MNPTTHSDIIRKAFVVRTTKDLLKLHKHAVEVANLQKELLEVNLSLTTYIEDSKSRLDALRNNLANRAKSSNEIVEIYSKKCKNNTKTMSHAPPTPVKRNPNKRSVAVHSSLKTYRDEDNNNSKKSMDRLLARTFVQWYKHMVDYERPNLCLYLTDDVVFEWFGRTIKTRKKVASFLKNDMQSTRHNFTSIESTGKLRLRQYREARYSESSLDDSLASPLLSPEIIKTRIDNRSCSSNSRKRPGLRANCESPEWETECNPQGSELDPTNKKRAKIVNMTEDIGHGDGDVVINSGKRPNVSPKVPDNDDVDGNLIRKSKRKCVQVTPTNCERGQGDCLPSTSDAMTEMSHAALNAQLPRKAVECNGYIEFMRTRNSRSMDSVKWERKCKMQISYAEDPLNVGEYIIWGIYYTDESKCRRNLLAAFEEVAKDELFSKKI